MMPENSGRLNESKVFPIFHLWVSHIRQISRFFPSLFYVLIVLVFILPASSGLTKRHDRVRLSLKKNKNNILWGMVNTSWCGLQNATFLHWRRTHTWHVNYIPTRQNSSTFLISMSTKINYINHTNFLLIKPHVLLSRRKPKTCTLHGLTI